MVCLITAVSGVLAAYGISRTVTSMAQVSDIRRAYRIVIDAGHGEPDGGATSCTGRMEHLYNLEIAQRLKDLMELLGHRTVMTRQDEYSVFKEGTTIAEKKISDLKERVRITNETGNSILISIHQNHYPDSRYSGPVVLYASGEESKTLASMTQQALNSALAPESKRQYKAAEGIYLLSHIHCPGILVECGFLSNAAEEAKLSKPAYQKQLCCVLAGTVSQYLANKEKA